MGKRRTNLFVLLFVLGLVPSRRSSSRRRDEARPRPQGRRRARLQGRPTGRADTRSAARTSIARSRSSASGSTSSASPSPKSRASARTRSGRPARTSPDAQRATEQVGATAQLYFYDWEPNLIGPRAGDRRPPRQAAAGGRDRKPREEWKEAGRNTEEASTNQQLIFAGAYPNAYEAVKLASEQEPVQDCSNCRSPDRATTCSRKTSRTN